MPILNDQQQQIAEPDQTQLPINNANQIGRLNLPPAPGDRVGKVKIAPDIPPVGLPAAPNPLPLAIPNPPALAPIPPGGVPNQAHGDIESSPQKALQQLFQQGNQEPPPQLQNGFSGLVPNSNLGAAIRAVNVTAAVEPLNLANSVWHCNKPGREGTLNIERRGGSFDLSVGVSDPVWGGGNNICFQRDSENQISGAIVRDGVMIGTWKYGNDTLRLRPINLNNLTASMERDYRLAR